MDKIEIKPEVSQIKEAADRIIENIGKVIVGKRDVIELVLVALFCEGHILIEDVPGIGKTMLAKATARSLGCSFKRIQFTPDLLPSDVTGIYYFNQKTSEFQFYPGPIISNIVLADEINRATPRTQSCLLECMQEQQITVGEETIPLPRPFLIIATQNPIELEGTFPLPEAQLDRFLLKIKLGYPTEIEEEAILSRFQQENPLDNLTSMIDSAELLKLQKLCRQIYIEDSVSKYIIAITRASRNHQGIELGASPRASLGLYLASQALAAIRGRSYVIPDDVKYLAVPALAHRLIAKTETRLRGRSPEDAMKEIVSGVPVPVEGA
ncbi:MAG: MoxR family ATPase [Dehalococcoidales bacterium]|nr:MoxR family ATPase [Dehalococcoidales bacterium]